MRALTFLIVAIMINFSCCKSQLYQAEELPGHLIKYGNGGGFTGEEKTYILLKNGQRFSSNSLTKVNKELEAVSKRKANDFFKAFTKLKLDKIERNNPGNTYKFLVLQTDTATYEVTWGHPDSVVPNEIKEIYADLIKL